MLLHLGDEPGDRVGEARNTQRLAGAGQEMGGGSFRAQCVGVPLGEQGECFRAGPLRVPVGGTRRVCVHLGDARHGGFEQGAPGGEGVEPFVPGHRRTTEGRLGRRHVHPDGACLRHLPDQVRRMGLGRLKPSREREAGLVQLGDTGAQSPRPRGFRIGRRGPRIAFRDCHLVAVAGEKGRCLQAAQCLLNTNS